MKLNVDQMWPMESWYANATSSSHGWIGRAGGTLCIIPFFNYLIFRHSSAVDWEFTMYFSSIQGTSSLSDSVANPWE
jgi:hypothetical protein